MCICKGLNKGLLGDSKNKECCSKWCVNKAKGARGIGYKRNWNVWAVKISKTQIKVKWMARELRVGHQGMVIPTWNPAVWKQSALDKSLSQFPLYRCCCCFVVVKKKKKKMQWSWKNCIRLLSEFTSLFSSGCHFAFHYWIITHCD